MIETAAPPRRDLHLIRLYYFVYIGAGGFLMPFLSLYYHRQGLSGTEIGLLGTVQATVSLVAAPLVGSLGDRFNRPRLIIQILLGGSAIVTLILGRQDQFLVIALLVALNALLVAGLMPLSDNLANNIAARYDGVGFGSIRLWGSLGWTLVTATAGRFIERMGLYVAFVGQAVGLAVSAVVMHFVPRQPREDTEQAGEEQEPLDIRRGLRAILHNPRLTSLALGLGFAWLLTSALYQFEAIFLDELGAGEGTIGMASALNALIELPAMLVADRLLKRFSAGWLLRAALLLQAARMIGILAVPSIPMIMAMRLLMGVQFSFYSVGIIGYVSAYSDKTYRVTALALITVTLRNLMVMIGSPISGVVYDAVGAYWLYAIGLIGALGGWLILQVGKMRANSEIA